jgi:flagellar protein FlaG
MLIAAGVAGSFTQSISDISSSIDSKSLDATQELRTDIEILSEDGDPVYNRSGEGNVTLVVKNTGKRVIPTEAGALEVLVDGQYRTNVTVTALDDERWGVGNVARVEISAPDLGDGRHRVELIAEGDREVLRFGTVTTLPSPDVLLDHLEAVYVTPGGQLSSVSDGAAPIRYAMAENASVTGPKRADFDGDGLREVPYVNSSGVLKTVNERNETVVTTATNSRTTNTKVSVGQWQGGETSMYYVRAGTETVYRVTPTGAPTEAWSLTSSGIASPAGFGDIDADGATEFVYADASQQLRYVDDDGTTEVKITNGGAGAGNSPAIGDPHDFDDDGKARIPYVDGSENLRLIDAAGNRVTLTSGADKSLLSSADIDGDGAHEVVFSNNTDLYYVDDVAGANTVKQVTTDDGTAVTADANTGAV